jgi:hypothetical protein
MHVLFLRLGDGDQFAHSYSRLLVLAPISQYVGAHRAPAAVVGRLGIASLQYLPRRKSLFAVQAPSLPSLYDRNLVFTG